MDNAQWTLTQIQPKNSIQIHENVQYILPSNRFELFSETNQTAWKTKFHNIQEEILKNMETIDSTNEQRKEEGTKNGKKNVPVDKK